MSGIDDTAIERVYQLAIRGHHLQYSLVFGLEEIVLDGIERAVYLLFQDSGIACRGAHTGCRVDENHGHRVANRRLGRKILGSQHTRCLDKTKDGLEHTQ